MRFVVFVLVFLFAMPAAHAQVGVIDMFRSLSGFIRGGKENQPQQQGATPVMGVRGIEETGAISAAPASGEYELMEGWAATKAEAEHAAGEKGIAARPVSFKKSAVNPVANEGEVR
jgi:hypothetical protein